MTMINFRPLSRYGNKVVGGSSHLVSGLGTMVTRSPIPGVVDPFQVDDKWELPTKYMHREPILQATAPQKIGVSETPD